MRTRFFLDDRSVSDDSPATLKYSISKGGKTYYVPLDIRIKRKEWDSSRQLVLSANPRYKSINNKLKHILVEYDDAVEAVAKRNMSAKEIRDAMIEYLSPTNKHILVDIMQIHANNAKTKRTRELYISTINRVKDFASSCKINVSDIDFDSIDDNWLRKFNNFLSKDYYIESKSGKLIKRNGCTKVNSRAVHLRNIRTIVNIAIDDGITTTYGFKRFSIDIEETQKRSLCIEDIRTLFFCKCENTKEQMALDLFKLMFFLIGINTIDLCKISCVDRNGRIEYLRTKTGSKKLYSIKVEPEAQSIIDKYKSDNSIFNKHNEYSNVHEFNKAVNKFLKKICERINIPVVTTYWARHSWATVANDIYIDYSSIQQGLGHSNGSVTDTYIRLKTNKVDVANRKVIDYVLFNKV